MTEAFWKRVNKGAADECWEWTGYCRPAAPRVLPYGTVEYKGATWRAHRLAYTLTFGEIPKGMCVCHKCDNPKCCNPAHLWLGSVMDNNRDRERKGRGVQICGKREGVNYSKGSHRTFAKFTEEQVAEIKRDPRTSRAIALEYGVHPTTISRMKTGVSWKHTARAAIQAMQPTPAPNTAPVLSGGVASSADPAA